MQSDRLDREREEWLRLSMDGLRGAYGKDEVEYSPDFIKAPNVAYSPITQRIAKMNLPSSDWDQMKREIPEERLKNQPKKSQNR